MWLVDLASSAIDVAKRMWNYQRIAFLRNSIASIRMAKTRNGEVTYEYMLTTQEQCLVLHARIIDSLIMDPLILIGCGQVHYKMRQFATKIWGITFTDDDSLFAPHATLMHRIVPEQQESATVLMKELLCAILVYYGGEDWNSAATLLIKLNNHNPDAEEKIIVVMEKYKLLSRTIVRSRNGFVHVSIFTTYPYILPEIGKRDAFYFRLVAFLPLIGISD